MQPTSANRRASFIERTASRTPQFMRLASTRLSHSDCTRRIRGRMPWCSTQLSKATAQPYQRVQFDDCYRGQANGAAVVDFYTFFNNVAANGYSLAGETYTTAYVEGGLFSLDGVHPSSRGLRNCGKSIHQGHEFRIRNERPAG